MWCINLVPHGAGAAEVQKMKGPDLENRNECGGTTARQINVRHSHTLVPAEMPIGIRK